MAPVNFTTAMPIEIAVTKNMIFPLDLVKPPDSPPEIGKNKISIELALRIALGVY
jgi:sporulation-control protein spo0M